MIRARVREASQNPPQVNEINKKILKSNDISGRRPPQAHPGKREYLLNIARDVRYVRDAR